MIETKLNEPESETVEYKKSISELKEGIISITSILNKHNKGVLYFGVDNDGEIIGLQINETTYNEISQAINNFIEPRIYPIITKQVVKDKHIILIEFEGYDTPYAAFDEFRIRIADEDKKIDIKELLKMLKKANVKTWDTDDSESTLNDINIEVLEDFYYSGLRAERIKFKWLDVKDTIERFGLLSNNIILNAGHIIFSNKAKLPVKMGVFATDTKITINDMNYVKTNLYDAVRICEIYFRNNSKWKVKFNDGSRPGFKREEIPEVPSGALREALFNSFIHRDMLSCIANEFCIFKDRIEVYNPGEFNNEYDIEEYLNGGGKSICRNQLLADTIYLSEDIEVSGTGLKKISDLCKEADVKVDFIKDKIGFTVIFWRKNVELEYVRKFDFKSLSTQEKNIVLHLETHKSMTRKDVESILSIKSTYSRRILNKLIVKNIVISEGKAKAIVYKLKKNYL